MDEQVQLLTSIRDILTRIERVLERIEGGSGLPADASVESPAREAPVPPVAPAAPGSVNPTSFGRAKWTKR